MKLYLKGKTTYIISRCQHCGSELSRKATYEYRRPGNPLVRCSNCGKYTIDNSIYELAEKPKQWYIDRRYKQPNPVLKAIVYAWLPVVYVGLGVTGNIDMLAGKTGLMIAAVLAYGIGICIFIRKGHGGDFVIDSKFEKDYAESAQRLADPLYRELLNSSRKR